jgi:hypothetical protein
MSRQVTLQLAENVQGIGMAGERVTLALVPTDIRDTTEIPEYLAGYTPYGFRADEASPVVLTDAEEAKYRTFDSDDAFRRVQVKGSTQGPVPEVDPKSGLSTYKVLERYIGSFVPRQTQLTQSSNNNYNPIMAASRRCKRAIMLDRELDAFALLGTSGNWNASAITAAGAVWTDDTLGDPILDIQTMVEKSAQMVNTVWMNQKIANRFLRHSKVRSHMRQLLGDGAASGVAAAVANAGNPGANSDFVIPGLPMIKVVASKVKNESTGLLDYVLGNVVIGVTVPPGGIPTDGEEIATTYTFRRKGISGTGLDVREFEVEGRGPLGGTMIVVSAADIPIMTANNAGGIITGV